MYRTASRWGAPVGIGGTPRTPTGYFAVIEKPGAGTARSCELTPTSDIESWEGAATPSPPPRALRRRADPLGWGKVSNGCIRMLPEDQIKMDGSPSAAPSTSPWRRLLGGAEEAVAGVAEARDDVGLVVEPLVDRRRHDVRDERAESSRRIPSGAASTHTQVRGPAPRSARMRQLCSSEPPVASIGSSTSTGRPSSSSGTEFM